MYPFPGSPLSFGAARFGPQQPYMGSQMGQQMQQMPYMGQQMPQMQPRMTAAQMLGMPPSSYSAMYGNQAMPITPTQYAPAARPMIPGAPGGLLGPAPVAQMAMPGMGYANPGLARPGSSGPNRGGPGDRGGWGPGRGGGFGGGQGPSHGPGSGGSRSNRF